MLPFLLAICIAPTICDPCYAYAANTSSDKALTAGVANSQSESSASYRILFNANGGKGAMKAQAIERGKSTALKANAFTRHNYKFVGWNTKKNGKGKTFKNKTRVKNLAKAGKTVTLYAQWRKSTIHKLEIDKTYTRFDITGDGEADRILIKGAAPDLSNAGPGYYRYLTVYVNGKKYATTPDSREPFGIYPQVKLVNLALGSSILYVHYSTSNAYYAGGWLYNCSAKGIRKILDTSVITSDYAKKHPDAYRVYETFSSVSVNDFKFETGSFTTDPSTYTYRYKGGRFIKR